MTIIEDTRQQPGKHEIKHRFFADNDIKVVRSKLPVGDYANIKNLSVVVDTKKTSRRLSAMLQKDTRDLSVNVILLLKMG